MDAKNRVCGHHPLELGLFRKLKLFHCHDMLRYVIHSNKIRLEYILHSTTTLSNNKN